MILIAFTCVLIVDLFVRLSDEECKWTGFAWGCAVCVVFVYWLYRGGQL